MIQMMFSFAIWPTLIKREADSGCGEIDQLRGEIYFYNYWDLMNRRVVSTEMELTDQFLEVCPLSIQFMRDYNTKFELYFQKNLQIISKYETPTSSIKKQETIYFSHPQQVQHFMVQPDKNLDYKWSLYIKRADIQGNHEEFVQGQKFNIKNQLDLHKSTKESNFECSVDFKNMKCKLIFLLSIANSPKELLSSFQKYSNDYKTSVITSDSRLALSAQEGSEISKKEGSDVNPFKKKTEHKQSLVEIMGDFNNNNSLDIPAPVVTINNKRQSLEITAEMKQSSTEVLFPKKRDGNYSNSLEPGEEDFKLSSSDLEIGNEIEEKINFSDKNSMPLSGFAQNTLSEEPTEKSQDKSIRMTYSQLLNEKGEVIVPFYKKKFVILIMVVLLLLVSGGIVLGSQNPTKKRQKKGKQINKFNEKTKEETSKKSKRRRK